MGDRRIVLLGKTGAGKSSTANTIFGEEVFKIDESPNAGTSKCAGETKSIKGRNITLIDTPGFFDPDMPKEALKDEIVKCIVECAPGPHAFLILLKVEKFTDHEKQVIDEIQKYFSEEAFKYAAVVFTHGDQLPEGMKIEEFVQENKGLSDLVKKCGGRCHVIDNKHWKNKKQDEYRSNQFQVAKLLNTMNKIVKENKGGCYTNEMLQIVDRMIKKNGKGNVSKILACITTGALLGALLGVSVFAVVKALVTAAGAAAGGAVAGVAAAGGAFVGGCIGYDQADQENSVGEAVLTTAQTVHDVGQEAFKIVQLYKKYQ